MALKREELIALVNIKLASHTSISADEHRLIELALTAAIFDRAQLGDIKEIAVDNLNDFETSGRGKSGTMRYGWAICNGYNGTVDKCGRVSTGINTALSGGSSGKPLWNKDIKYPSGAETVSISVNEMPAHTHDISSPSVWLRSVNDNGSASALTNTYAKYPTTNAGGNASGAADGHNNMQPYVVSVFVQKIPENY